MKLHSLQAFRALAAWLVVADHALLDVIHDDPQNPRAPIAWALGSSGVYVFFVISGFIMVHISWDHFGRKDATTNFLRRRVIRIVPLYWLATIAALAFHQISATHGASAGWPELTRSLLFIPYRDDAAQWRPILAQGWTLSYEMMFYAIFAMALMFRRTIALVTVGVGLSVLTLAGPFLRSAALEHLASPIVLWFVLGVALGALWRGAGLSEPAWLARRLQFLEPFGDASYSTYLVHGLALTLLLRIWMMAVGTPSAWFIPVGLVFATAAGCLVHMAIEKPLLRMAFGLSDRIGEIAVTLQLRRQPTK
jgi:exopolysaccharide production protein ExoZ